MPQTERINPKTGQKQYRGLFQYYTPDGKMHYNNTGWCDTKEQAKAEAAKLKKIKKEEISLSFQRRDKTLETAFESFIEEYGKKATRVTTDNTCTENSIWRWAKTIQNKYMPLEVKQAATKDISAALFRDWLTYINGQELSGAYIRNLKYCLNVFNEWLRDNGYYIDRNLDLDVKIALSKTKIKLKTHRNRQINGERKLIHISELQKVGGYFFKQGISNNNPEAAYELGLIYKNGFHDDNQRFDVMAML